ncbi:MAG: type I-MYXAN CRISPR-associated endonuclease Cas1 [Candidatus Sericytochromatia bacterium]
MIQEDVHEPLLRVMSLHALTYCKRLFYLEEVEEIRLADASVYAGRTLHEEMQQREQENGQWQTHTLTSQFLGLIGKLDYLRRRDGVLIPYELKRGRAQRQGTLAQAWETDKVQLGAYALLLEEHTGESIQEGRIHYHRDRVTVRVRIDDELRAQVFATILDARSLRATTERPPVTENDRLCLRCSLAPVCLPEEERLASDPDWEPVRLFPMERETRTLHVIEHSARIGKAGETLKVQTGENTRQIPLHEIHSLVLHGYPQMTTQALQTCARNGIGVHWISGGGYYTAGLWSGAGHVQKRIRQYKALADPNFCLTLAQKLVMAKVESSLRYLLRATRGKAREEMPELLEQIQIMRQCLKRIARASDLAELRGHEGLAGRAYFGILPLLLREELPDSLRLSGRNRRPPKDRFNALLSFGYTLLYQAILQAVMVVELDPALGFFHQPRSSSYPLVLDLMELFRLSVWDITVLGSLNRLQWDEDADFSVTPERVWLSDIGKRKAITLFEKRLDEVWKHPVVNYSLSYARLMELEVRLLEKEWTGQVGLFARMRLK